MIEPFKSLAPKLPIKRKIPDPFIFDPDSSTPFPRTVSAVSGGGPDGDHAGSVVKEDPEPPPFKFHRIWTEPDEIRFLQGLIHGASEKLFFPRDLNIFYTRFSNTMSQPYTKSQLSEKLRRLRKKFRVISTRLDKGLDRSMLSIHDRALYDLSKQLWHPDFSATSPFSSSSTGSDKSKNSNLVGVNVSFVPNLPSVSAPNRAVIEDNIKLEHCNNDKSYNGNDEIRDGVLDGDEKLREVNVELDGGNTCLGGPVKVGIGYGIGEIAAKVVMDVFDECLKDHRNVIGERSNFGGLFKDVTLESFEERWREQRVSELDVLTRRLKLVLEHSLQSR